MMDLNTIKAINEEKAKKCKEDGTLPFVVETEEDKNNLRRIPNIGDYRPVGYELVDTFFVDSSGLGVDDEPAMTYPQFLNKVKIGFGYAIIEAGQFQVYIGEFKINGGN